MNILNGPNGNPKTVTKNLPTQFASLSLDDLKHHANQYFLGDENSNNVPNKAAMIVTNIDPANNAMHKRCYYRLVHSSISNFRKEISWKKGDEWVYNGPTIGWLMLTKLSLTSNIGVTAEICFIKTVKLSQYNNDVHDMLDIMELKYNKI
eukprot:34825-Ditylum_brightwellii.AAC.1